VCRLTVYFCCYLTAQHPVLLFWMCVLHLLNKLVQRLQSVKCEVIILLSKYTRLVYLTFKIF